MDTIIQSLQAIDQQAAAVLAGVSDAKKELSAANEAKVTEFDSQSQSETDSRINSQKKESTRVISEEADTLKGSTETRIAELEAYYNQHHDAIAGQIFEKITGHPWKA